MNLKTWLPLILAVLLGLLAMVLARKFSGPQQVAAAPSGNMTKVVILAHDVAPGTELGEKDLMMGTVGSESLPTGSFTEPAQLNGRVAAVMMVKGQPIVDAMLAPSGSAAGLQALIPAGMRAITIEINEFSGLANMIVPGSHVDVITTLQGDAAGESGSHTIVQDIKVTAVGQQVTPQKKDGNEEQQKPYRSVTLLVTPEQAEQIELASSNSRPRLVLRSAKDDAIANTAGATLTDLRHGGKRQVDPMLFVGNTLPTTMPSGSLTSFNNATLPAGVKFRTVQLFRGSLESQIQFPMLANDNSGNNNNDSSTLDPSSNSSESSERHSNLITGDPADANSPALGANEK